MSVAYMNEEFAYYHNLWNEKKREGTRRFSEGAPLSECISTVFLVLSDICAGRNRIMSFKDIKKLAKDLKSIDYQGAVSLCIYDKQPEKLNLFDIARYIKDELIDASVFLHTSGFYVNAGVKEELEETADAVAVNVSGKEELERIKNLDIKTGLYAFVQNMNEDLVKYEGDSLKFAPCRTFIDKVIVSPAGDIYLCDAACGEDYALGNVFGKKSFGETIDSPKLRNIQAELLAGNRGLYGACKNCRRLL